MERHTIPTAEFLNLSRERTFQLLAANESGLSDAEAQARLALYGRNEIIERKRHPLGEFLLRFWGPMPWLLELAMILAFALKHRREGIIIFILLTVNAIIGFLHAHGARKAVELLKERLAIRTKVLRNSISTLVDAKELVPGDIIVVRIGDIIPVDAKIILGNLSVDESTLTGESLPSGKKEADLIYSGSTVRRGEARCIVINTGGATYFGKTAELVGEAGPESHQEQLMLEIVRNMVYLAAAACLLITISAFFMHTSIRLIPTFIVIFLMGAVPAALPVVMTIIQAATARQLVTEGVLVSRLEAIENAASVRFLCLDKTGTITENKLRVVNTVAFSGFERERVIQIAALASRSEEMDLIDLAIIEYAERCHVPLEVHKTISYTPFDPEIKRTEAVVEREGNVFRVVKGSPSIILSLCTGLDATTRGSVEKEIQGASEKGSRTIAVAESRGQDVENLHLVGLIFLADPPRADSKKMIEEIRTLGIKPILLTGDSLAIAREIALKTGIGANIIRFADIQNLDEAFQAEKIVASDGFAEIFPEDKYKIVKLLQSKGYIVGMTGDGVNDSPALKQAEMGIAVSNATDIAKASASVVLTKAGVSVIVDAIRASREAYERMLTWVINKVSKVIQFVGVLVIGFFLMDKMVLSLLGMVLLVFANDFVTMSLATDNVKNSASPNNWNVRNITLASLVVGGLLVLEGVAALVWGNFYLRLPFVELQTFIMLMLVFTSQFRVLILRERHFFWSSLPGTALLTSSVATILVFVLVGVYGVIVPPISLGATLAVLAFSALFTLAIDVPKYYAFRKFEL
jgi:H+-transporting ATPase